MTVSLKSNDVYTVDLPEVRDVTTRFKYNFYVPDEGATEDTRAKPTVVYRDAPDFESYVSYAAERIPRFVMIRFSPTHIAEPNRKFTYEWFRRLSYKPQQGGIIQKNLSKIVDEDHFSSHGYTAVQFHDGDLATKARELVSASMAQHIYTEDYEGVVSEYRKSVVLGTRTPESVSTQLIIKSFSSMVSDPNTTMTKEPTQQSRGDVAVDGYFEDLGTVSVHSQINNKVLYDLIDRAVKQPTTPESSDLISLHTMALTLQKESIRMSNVPGAFNLNVPFVAVRQSTSSVPSASPSIPTEVIGYVIDKLEVLPEGKTRLCDPIIVENSSLGTAVDFNVRYGATYMYAVRTVARVTLSAVDETSDQLVDIDVLLSSRPSNCSFVICTEDCPPPPPTDLNFRWDYGYVRESTSDGTGRLMITWTFPPNPQQDIKKFQVLRRRTVDEPFILIKEYDFNDAVVPLPRRELPGPGVSETMVVPKLYYYDMDFVRQTSADPGKSSQFIYAVAAVDAHELSSCYSDQFSISFDPYKNRLVKTLVSHSGAPKPYPNMYLESDTFVDAVVDEGHDRVRIYFNPEFFEHTNDSGKTTKAFLTKQTGGTYKFQFVSLSTQESEFLTVTIDDKRQQLIKERNDVVGSILSKTKMATITRGQK